MRILVSIVLLCFTLGLVYGQERPEMSDRNPSGGPSEEEINKKEINIEHKMNAWTLVDQFSREKTFKVDTATLGFHVLDPIYRKSISNTSLGFIGSPYVSNIYFDRTRENSFYFLQNFDAYHRSNSDVVFYNTTTPYASLTYSESMVNGDKGQVFKAFFTQNIDSVTNWGFIYDVMKMPGNYLYQSAAHRALNAFASHNSERYNAYVSVMTGGDDVTENGGIADSTVNQTSNMYIPFVNYYLRKTPEQFAAGFLNQIENTGKSISVFTSHEYKMGRLPFFVDSLTVDSIPKAFEPRYSIQYSAEFEHHSRMLYEKTVNSSAFDTTFINLSEQTDSTFFNRFSHILQFNILEDETKKFTFGKRAFIENELVNASYPLLGGRRKYTYSNVYVGGEIYRTESDLGSWNAIARFAILGRNIGDASIKGTWAKEIRLGKDTTLLIAEGWYQDRSANLFQEHWYGNHFKWDNKFKKEHEVVVKGSYSYPRFRTEAGVNYALLSNYLYNNEEALPAQYNGEFSIISAYLNKDFVLGRFGWSNKMVWQELSNDAVLHLPVWNFYSSVYYSHYLFKVMKIQLGAEIYYHTKFKADSYEPSTTRFYLQNDIETGAYPLINFYANAKLKRTSAFVKLYHANSMLMMGDFFGSPHYPLDMMTFRFGFLWTFYD